MAILGRTNT